MIPIHNPDINPAMLRDAAACNARARADGWFAKSFTHTPTTRESPVSREIRAHLRRWGPKTTAEIAEGTGIPRPSIASCLSRMARTDPPHITAAGPNGRTVWHLADAGLRAALDEAAQ